MQYGRLLLLPISVWYTIYTIMIDYAGINIQVKLSNGNVVTLKVDHVNTIGMVKAQIQDELGYPIHQQRLFFAGKGLHDENKLCDYNIQEGHTLDLVLSK